MDMTASYDHPPGPTLPISTIFLPLTTNQHTKESEDIHARSTDRISGCPVGVLSRHVLSTTSYKLSCFLCQYSAL